jgi:hypothetical protein
MDWATSFSLPELLNDQRSLFIFFFVNVCLGGGAAIVAGRALAATWRPWWQVFRYMLLLGIAVRFIHFAIYQSVFLSLHYYLVDTAVCLIFGLLSYRLKRVQQMVTCYNWINQRSGLFGWRRRDGTTLSEPG